MLTSKMLTRNQKKQARVIAARECEESRANNAEQIRIFREYLAERFEVLSLSVGRREGLTQ